LYPVNNFTIYFSEIDMNIQIHSIARFMFRYSVDSNYFLSFYNFTPYHTIVTLTVLCEGL